MIIKFENTRLSIFNPTLIIPLSVFACLFVLWIERTLGIEWDFHPDVNTYINHANGTAFRIFFHVYYLANHFT